MCAYIVLICEKLMLRCGHATSPSHVLRFSSEYRTTAPKTVIEKTLRSEHFHFRPSVISSSSSSIFCSLPISMSNCILPLLPPILRRLRHWRIAHLFSYFVCILSLCYHHCVFLLVGSILCTNVPAMSQCNMPWHTCSSHRCPV